MYRLRPGGPRMPDRNLYRELLLIKKELGMTENMEDELVMLGFYGPALNVIRAANNKFGLHCPTTGRLSRVVCEAFDQIFQHIHFLKLPVDHPLHPKAREAQKLEMQKLEAASPLMQWD